jgi:uncharacterized protein YecE (DUF72 family)
MVNRSSPVVVGTAGWAIPASSAHLFSRLGTHLERYAGVLCAVEINSSFHRPHRRSTYERWAASVPPDFRFAVKMPKTISHLHRLVDAELLVDAFLKEVAGLGEKLEVVLVQLPPSFGYDEVVASGFLARLRESLADEVSIVCEPRHGSWFTCAANACFVDHRIARVAANPVLVPGGGMPGGWKGLTYRRLHGAPRIYHSPYNADFSRKLSATLDRDNDPEVRQWCIFDNTASGAAIGNALALRAVSGNGPIASAEVQPLE